MSITSPLVMEMHIPSLWYHPIFKVLSALSITDNHTKCTKGAEFTEWTAPRMAAKCTECPPPSLSMCPSRRLCMALFRGMAAITPPEVWEWLGQNWGGHQTVKAPEEGTEEHSWGGHESWGTEGSRKRDVPSYGAELGWCTEGWCIPEPAEM